MVTFLRSLLEEPEQLVVEAKEITRMLATMARRKRDLLEQVLATITSILKPWPKSRLLFRILVSQ